MVDGGHGKEGPTREGLQVKVRGKEVPEKRGPQKKVYFET